MTVMILCDMWNGGRGNGAERRTRVGRYWCGCNVFSLPVECNSVVLMFVTLHYDNTSQDHIISSFMIVHFLERAASSAVMAALQGLGFVIFVFACPCTRKVLMLKVAGGLMYSRSRLAGKSVYFNCFLMPKVAGGLMVMMEFISDRTNDEGLSDSE